MGPTEKFVVWMSLGSMPSAFKASTTLVMAAVFLSSASPAFVASLVTPVETSTLSGVVLMAPVATREMVRFCGSSWASAGGVWSGARAMKASKAMWYLGDREAMGALRELPASREDCPRAQEAQINFRQFA